MTLDANSLLTLQILYFSLVSFYFLLSLFFFRHNKIKLIISLFIISLFFSLGFFFVNLDKSGQGVEVNVIQQDFQTIKRNEAEIESREKEGIGFFGKAQNIFKG